MKLSISDVRKAHCQTYERLRRWQAFAAPWNREVSRLIPMRKPFLLQLPSRQIWIFEMESSAVEDCLNVDDSVLSL